MIERTPPTPQKNIFDDFGDGIGMLLEKLITTSLPQLSKKIAPLLSRILHFQKLRRRYKFIEITASIIERVFKINKLNIIEYSDTFNIRRPPHPTALGWAPIGRFHLLSEDFDNYCNTLVTGGTGTGKTVFLNTLVNRCASKAIPHVVIDPKGDMDELMKFITINKFHKRDYLIFTVIKGFKNKTIGYNPVKDGTCSEIADRIMNAFVWSESFYQNESKIALIFVIEAILKAKEIVTLERILYRLVEGSYDQKVISGLKSQLLAICKSDFGPLVNSDKSLSLNELRKEHKNIYLGLCSGSHPTIAPVIGKLMIGDLRSHSAEVVGLSSKDRKVLFPKMFEVFFDEFAHFVCEDMIEVCNKDRASNISVTLCVQSLSDLSKGENKYFDRLIENIKNRIIFQQEGPNNVDIAMKLGGTSEIMKESQQVAEGSETGLGSTRYAHRCRFSGETIRNLKRGQCLIKIASPREEQILLNVLMTDILKMEKANLESDNFNVYDYCKNNAPTIIDQESLQELRNDHQHQSSISSKAIQEKPLVSDEIKKQLKKSTTIKRITPINKPSPF